MEEGLNFDLPKNRSSVIKVIGVGGGGSNAVNHMKRLGINGVDFVVCNTDSQALEHSPVENKIQLGVNLTEGLGAGANPEVGERAALETIEDVKSVLEHNTKMLFITAGMGGGTGTGAAPIIAGAARDMGILTVGIVTIPFAFEGKIRLQQAKKGIEKFKENLDSLIVINNNKLREVYGNLGFKAGFAKADEVLATAAKGIAEVITHHYTANIDLKDAKTVLANSGTAIMGSAKASGQNRAMDAIQGALDSPLLNDNHIVGAKNVLLLIVCGSDENEITFDEIGEVNDFIQNEAGGDANIIMGIGEDTELGDAVSITIIATGFSAQTTVQPFTKAQERVVHNLDENDVTEQPIQSEAPSSKVTDSGSSPNIVQGGLFDIEPYSENETEDVTEEPIVEASKRPEIIGEEVHEEIIAEERSSIEEPEEVVNEMPEPVTSEKDTEERIVFDLGDFDIQNEEDFVIEDEPKIEEAVAEVQEDPSEEDVFEFSIDEAFTGGIVEQEAAQPNVEWEVTDSAEETEPEAVKEPVPDETTPAHEEVEESYEEVRFQLNDDEVTNDVQLDEFEQPAAQSQPTAREDGKVVHTLDDLRELEARLGLSNSDTKKEETALEQDEDLQFEVKEKVENLMAEPEDHSDPLDRPIQESLRKRNEERKSRLEAFNYKFKNVQGNIMETEKEPAYKRQGVDLDASKQSEQAKLGNTSIGGDSEGLEFRSNNSFLHDNVD